jgi:hypothetical protein
MTQNRKQLRALVNMVLNHREAVKGSCEHGIEPSGFIKCWEVIDYQHNWQFLKKGSAPL